MMQASSTARGCDNLAVSSQGSKGRHATLTLLSTARQNPAGWRMTPDPYSVAGRQPPGQEPVAKCAAGLRTTYCWRLRPLGAGSVGRDINRDAKPRQLRRT